MNTLRSTQTVDFHPAASPSSQTENAVREIGILAVPHGASPALDLQRQLEAAAMRSFYAKERPADRTRLDRVWVVLACAATSWAAVFGIGYAILG